MPLHGLSLLNRFFTLMMILSIALSPSLAQSGDQAHPWTNSSLSPDERASMVVKEMTLDEKISMLHGTGMAGLSPMSPLAVHSNGGAGYVVGIPRLGIPANSDVGRRLRSPEQRREWPLLDGAARGRRRRGELGSRMRPTNTEL